MAAQDGNQLILPIIDSHIHLWPEAEAQSLNFYEPGHQFSSQQSVQQYRAAAQSSPSLLGFVFVETDRKNDPDAGARDASGWQGPLDEIRWMRRIVTGQPRPGEGHSADDAKLCLGIVPWAPVASGPDVLEKYLQLAEETAGQETWARVKGFRFLLQDKPHGTMVQDSFIAGLKLLGRKGFAFDVGVDQCRRGKKQLDEAVEMIDRAHDGVPEDEKVTFILDHLCKPDLTIYNITSDPSFHAWRTAIYTLSKCSRTYMKLSGSFTEMPDSLKNQPPARIFEATLGWLGIVLATFGPSRIMFGSDWPVCALGVDDAWPRWRDVVEKMCYMASLEDEQRAMIFGGTAKAAYNL